METAEIRVNNWYHSVKWDKPVICELSDLVQIYYISDGAVPDSDHISIVFKAIPLTEDWLRRFGWSKERQYDFFGSLGIKYHKGTDSFLLCEEDDNNVTTHAFPQIKYVHQLQNLHFDLTGQELKFKNEPQS